MIDDIFKHPPTRAARERMKEEVLKTGSVACQTVGKSIMGEDIDLYTIGNGGVRVAYFGAHHSLESITCNLLFTFIHELSRSECFSFGYDADALLSLYTYMVVPCVNPDGIGLVYEGCSSSPIKDRQIRMSGGDFRRWQANARGVDLNHNYAVGFYDYKRIESEKGITPGATLYSGEYPESEPEVRCVSGLVRSTAPAGIISLHSQGEEIYSFPRSAAVTRIAERLSHITGYKSSIPVGTAAFGGLSDFSGALGIPSFTLEVGRGENPLPLSDLEGIHRRLSGALAIFPTLL